MSVTNHPNIHAVGFTCDLIESFYSRLRGEADKNHTLAFVAIHNDLIEFVTKVSTSLDAAFGCGQPGNAD